MRRNSRLTFYSTIGVQFGAGANNLEAIFKENVLDLDKLRSVCLKYEIPVMYRHLLWKVLLGVVPPQKECWAFIDDTKEAQYQDIKHFAMLLNMRKPSSSLNWGDSILKEKMTSKEKVSLYERRAELISTVYHTKQSYMDSLTFTNKEEMETEYSNEEVERLARVIVSVFEEESEAYWSLTRLLHLQTKQLLEGQLLLLSKLMEMQQPTIWQHLSSHSISLSSFAYSWFSSLFSSCISSLPSLQRIWDKVIGVGSDLMACLGFAILSKLKPVILTIDHRAALKKRLNATLDSEFNIDNVLNSAIETASSSVLADALAFRAIPASSSNPSLSTASAAVSLAPVVASPSTASSTLPATPTSPVSLPLSLLPPLSSSTSPTSSMGSFSPVSLPASTSSSASSSASTPSPSALLPPSTPPPTHIT